MFCMDVEQNNLEMRDFSKTIGENFRNYGMGNSYYKIKLPRKRPHLCFKTVRFPIG